MAALTAGCFQPMYAEHADGSPACVTSCWGSSFRRSTARTPRRRRGSGSRSATPWCSSFTGAPPAWRRPQAGADASQTRVVADRRSQTPACRPAKTSASMPSTSWSSSRTNKSVMTGDHLLARVLRHARAPISASPARARSATPKTAPPRRSPTISRRGSHPSSSPAPDAKRLPARRSPPGCDQRQDGRAARTDIDAFLARPDPGRPIVLLYGPDAGLVRERADAMLASAVDDPNDPFSLVRLDGDELAAEPSRLVDEAHDRAAVRWPPRDPCPRRLAQFRRRRRHAGRDAA